MSNLSNCREIVKFLTILTSMSESSKMGALKYKNKQKYKNKSKVVQKIKGTESSVDDGDKIVIDDDYPYRRRGLESNWHRYETKDEPEEGEEVVDLARDFSAIISAPVSQGNYFQFKSDKNLEDYEEERLENDIFKLDMKLLSMSLSCIPFNVRCNIDSRYFSEEDLNIINANAIKAEEQYEKTLREIEEKKLESKMENCDISEEILSLEESLPPLPSKKDDVKRGTEEKTVNEETRTEKDDLEEWLDDILDD